MKFYVFLRDLRAFVVNCFLLFAKNFWLPTYAMPDVQFENQRFHKNSAIDAPIRMSLTSMINPT